MWTVISRSPRGWASDRRMPSTRTSTPTLFPVHVSWPRVLGGVPVLAPLPPRAVEEALANDVAVVDIRTPGEFAGGHIPNSYGIPLVSPLIPWGGWVVPFGSPMILVADHPIGREEATRQLIRIGDDDLRGYLDGGIAAWQAAGFPTARTRLLTPA